MSPDPSSDEPLFHVSHIDRVYTLKTETLNERCGINNEVALEEKTISMLLSCCLCAFFVVVVVLFRTMWVQKIKAASEHFIETEKKKREKAYQGNSSDVGGFIYRP